MHRIETRVF